MKIVTGGLDLATATGDFSPTPVNKATRGCFCYYLGVKYQQAVAHNFPSLLLFLFVWVFFPKSTSLHFLFSLCFFEEPQGGHVFTYACMHARMRRYKQTNQTEDIISLISLTRMHASNL